MRKQLLATHQQNKMSARQSTQRPPDPRPQNGPAPSPPGVEVHKDPSGVEVFYKPAPGPKPRSMSVQPEPLAKQKHVRASSDRATAAAKLPANNVGRSSDSSGVKACMNESSSALNEAQDTMPTLLQDALAHRDRLMGYVQQQIAAGKIETEVSQPQVPRAPSRLGPIDTNPFSDKRQPALLLQSNSVVKNPFAAR